jgi:hypothetical protein
MRLRRAWAAASLVAAVLAAASCGVTLDDAPRALGLPPTTTTAAPSPAAGQHPVTAYYVSEAQLVPLTKLLPDRSIETVIGSLLEPPGDGLRGLASSIPPGTRLVGLQREGDQVAVNLSEEFDNVVGVSRQQAVGQIVMTLTELDGIGEVMFRVAGQDVLVTSPLRGDTDVVGECDYASMLMAADAMTGPLASHRRNALDGVTERGERLADECPAPESLTSD